MSTFERALPSLTEAEVLLDDRRYDDRVKCLKHIRVRSVDSSREEVGTMNDPRGGSAEGRERQRFGSQLVELTEKLEEFVRRSEKWSDQPRAENSQIAKPFEEGGDGSCAWEASFHVDSGTACSPSNANTGGVECRVASCQAGWH
jgi:hypothetical protein